MYRVLLSVKKKTLYLGVRRIKEDSKDAALISPGALTSPGALKPPGALMPQVKRAEVYLRRAG